MALNRSAVSLPDRAAPGETVQVKTLTRHPMETGYRPGADGKLFPRDIVRLITARYLGREVFRMELFPAIAANPLVVFPLRAEATGEIEIRWEDDKGEVWTVTKTLTVA